MTVKNLIKYKVFYAYQQSYSVVSINFEELSKFFNKGNEMYEAISAYILQL